MTKAGSANELSEWKRMGRIRDSLQFALFVGLYSSNLLHLSFSKSAKRFGNAAPPRNSVSRGARLSNRRDEATSPQRQACSETEFQSGGAFPKRSANFWNDTDPEAEFAYE
jgi:hypothetical protein